MIKTILLTIALSLPVAANAADISIGPLCMTGVASNVHPSDISVSNGFQWMRVEHSYDASKNKTKASLIVFSKPIPSDSVAPPNCKHLRELAAANGIGIILDGVIDSLYMKSRLGVGMQGNRLWIDPDGSLLLTMKKATSGLQPVWGGTLQLKGSVLWVRNVGTFLSTPERVSGSLEIEAYNRSIVDAHITLPGGATATATLKQRNPNLENLFLHVDMATGNAKIWRGDLVATKVKIDGPALLLPKLKLSDLHLNAEIVRLTADRDSVRAQFSKITGSTHSMVTDEGTLQFNADSVSLSKAGLSGLATQGPTGFLWQPMSAHDVLATSNLVSLASTKDILAKGPAVATFSHITSTDIHGVIEWTRPDISNFPLTIPQGKSKTLVVSLAGHPNALKIGGSVEVGAFSLSGLQIDRDLTLQFAPTASNTVLAIPISVNTPGVGGEIQLSDYDQKVLVRATLADFRLRATLFLDLSNLLNGSRLQIPATGLSAGLLSALSLQPWLAGTNPGFGNVKVMVGNKKDVVIRKSNPTGNFDLDADVLVLAQPILRFGEAAEPRRASIILNTTGKASLTYGAANRVIVTQKARFELLDVLDLHMLDPGGSVDIGGTLVTEPRIKLKHLLIDLDRGKDVRIAEGEKLEIHGRTFERTRKEKTETAFNGNQQSPFSIEKIAGEPEFNDTSITIRSINAETLKFAIDHASLTLGDSLILREATVALSADRIRSVDEVQKRDDGTDETDEHGNIIRKRREYFTNLSIAASGKLRESEFSDTMQLDVPPTVSHLTILANGRSDLLDGSGGFHISPFSGLYKSTVEFKFACKGGIYPRVPTETRFSTDGTPAGDLGQRLGVQIDRGKFGVHGALIGLSLLYKSDTTYECDSDSEKRILSPQQEWWTWGICVNGFEIRRCKWSTVVPEVSFGYHFRFGFYHLSGAANIAAPLLTIKDGQTKFCFLPPVLFNPLVIAMGITPQVEFNGTRPGDAEKVLNGLIHAALVPMESALVTATANTAALGAGATLNTPGGALLACALLRKDIIP